MKRRAYLQTKRADTKKIGHINVREGSIGSMGKYSQPLKLQVRFRSFGSRDEIETIALIRFVGIILLIYNLARWFNFHALFVCVLCTIS